MKRFFKGRRTLAAGVITLGAAVLPLQGCDSAKDMLLQPNNPDIINPSDLNSADGADALRIGALQRLSTMTAGGESTWLLGGLLTDEWKSGDTFIERDEADQRNVRIENANVNTAYRNIHRARNSAALAIQYLRKYAPSQVSKVGQMYFVKGFAELTSAENFCNGQPFSNSDGDVLSYGSPISSAEAFQMAIADFDSALTNLTGADTIAAKVLPAVKIAKARALMGLGKYAEAAALVPTSAVASNYQWLLTFSQTSVDNQIWALNNSAKRWTVGDSADVMGLTRNAIPFVSAKDPRVPTAQLDGSGKKATVSFDSKTPFWAQQIWADRGASVALVSGTDARLIEAEAKLAAGDAAGWLGILNTLRAGVAGLAPLTDPGSADARVSLQFREKAFWTFGRGQRLGDLRRLVRQYSRTQDNVFPVGPFFKGGNYGTDVNLPVTQAETNNPKFTGCTDRRA